MKAFRLSVLVLVSLQGCSDIQQATYESVDQARAAGAIERGWIPSFLPPSAVRIEEHHSIDTSRGWVRFHAPWRDLAAIGDMNRRINAASFKATDLVVPDRPSDWPQELRRPLMMTPRASLLAFRRLDQGHSWCLAVDSVGEVGFAWHCDGAV